MRRRTPPLALLLGLLVVLVLLCGVPRSARAEEALLDTKMQRSFSTLALGLARKGHKDAFTELVDVLRSLGVSTEDVAKVEKKGAEQLARAKKVRDAKADRKKLAKLIDALAARLAALEPEKRTYLAEVLLRLDAEQAAAREALGHVRHRGRWTPSTLVPLLERRAEVEKIVNKHRKANFEIEVGVSDEPTFRQAYGDKGAVARHKTIEVHVARTGAAGARRILLQTLRAWALAAELAGLPADFIPELRIRVAFHGTHAEYLRSIEQAVAAGRLQRNEVQKAKDHRTYRTTDRYLVAGSGIEAHHQTFVLFDVWYGHCRRHWKDKQPLPCLEAGFLNWTMLQMMGCPMPRITWLETEYDRKLGATLSEKDNVTRKHLLRMSRAGLAGTRAYMRFLMERRIDPPWINSFHDVIGKVRGHDLLKCTIVIEYLLELGRLPWVFEQTLDTDTKSVTATTAGLEKATGRPLKPFEDDVRAWLTHRVRPGLVQRLGGATAAADSAGRGEPVPYLTSIRERAFRRSNPITLEPDLSKGATAHAQYLARHPEQAAAWPDAHEEYVDHEGYSPAGARAGASSVIAPGSADWKQAVDSWMGTYFHRLPLLDPGLLGIGAGLEGGMAVLDTSSLVDEWETRAYIAWPPKGATAVPLRFAPELPNPVPGVSQVTMGYPITLQIYADSGQPDMTMKLFVSGGGEVPCHFSAPHAPLNPELVPIGAYCLIPKAPLAPGTLYTVQVDGIVNESAAGKPGRHQMKWSFRTQK